MLLLFIFFFLFLAAIISWLRNRKKKIPSPNLNPSPKGKDFYTGENKISVPEKIIEEKKEVVVAEEKIIAPVVDAKEILPEVKIAAEKPEAIISPSPEKEIEVVVYTESLCNLKEHLLFFSEILLNKKFTEQEWDKRIPEQAMLDFKSYHRLVFLLLQLNSESEQTVSRFKLVLETSNEIALNHQIYFRNWMMPENFTAAFKSGKSFSSVEEKNISTAVKIASLKNWKLQSSVSEQGTMINLLMKLKLPVFTNN